MSLDAYVFDRTVYVKRKVLAKIQRDKFVKACEGIYSAHDVAAFFGIKSTRTVYAIWHREPPNDQEPINIPVNVKWKELTPDYEEDFYILMNRGMSLEEAAKILGFHPKWAEKKLKETTRGREALLNSDASKVAIYGSGSMGRHRVYIKRGAAPAR